jgi:YlmC/YmxH family sporulation protein
VININNKGLDFKHKEVINITDARRLGFVQDVTADLKTGTITSIIVPGNSNKIFGLFSSNSDITIPWENITCIRRRYHFGEDLNK